MLISEEKNLRVTFLDYFKAFDTINYNILLKFNVTKSQSLLNTKDVVPPQHSILIELYYLHCRLMTSKCLRTN